MPFDQTIERSRTKLKSIYSLLARFTITEYAGLHCTNSQLRVKSQINGADATPLLQVFNDIYDLVLNKKEQLDYLEYENLYVLRLQTEPYLNEFFLQHLNPKFEIPTSLLEEIKLLFLLLLQIKRYNSYLNEVAQFMTQFDIIFQQANSRPESNIREINQKLQIVSENTSKLRSSQNNFSRIDYKNKVAIFTKMLDDFFDNSSIGFVATLDKLLQCYPPQTKEFFYFDDIKQQLLNFREDLNVSVRNQLPTYQHPLILSLSSHIENLEKITQLLKEKKLHLIQDPMLGQQRIQDNEIKRNESLQSLDKMRMRYNYENSPWEEVKTLTSNFLYFLMRNLDTSHMEFEFISDLTDESYALCVTLSDRNASPIEKRNILTRLSEKLQTYKTILEDEVTLSFLDNILHYIDIIMSVMTGIEFDFFNQNRIKYNLQNAYDEACEFIHAIQSNGSDLRIGHSHD